MREPPPPPPAPETERHFPCAACGADLRYAPGQTQMRCDYCGHAQDIPAAAEAARRAALRPLDYRVAVAERLPPAELEEVRVSTCPNCGAQVEISPDVHSTECPFCATPVVTDTGTRRHIKPQAVLPFRLTEAEARAAFGKWLRGLWFAPNGLRRFARSEGRLTGIYLPYWAFDADTRSRYRGERGTHYYTGSGKNRRRHTRWRSVSGRVARRFDDVLIMAAQSLPRRYVRALEPWLLSDLEPYDPGFLAGFRAEAYTIDLEQGFDLARARMDEVIRNDVRHAIGGDTQRIHAIATETSAETFKHILLPIWVAAYRYRGESYRFVVNAQTGKVKGERPWSWLKIGLAALAAAAVLGAVILYAEAG